MLAVANERPWPRCILSLWEGGGPLCDALGAQLTARRAHSGRAVAVRPGVPQVAQAGRSTRVNRREHGTLVVTRAAHGRLRHQVAADRAEIATAAQRGLDERGGFLVAEHVPHAW